MRLPASEKLRSSTWSSNRICRPDERWRCSASSRRHFIAGMKASDPAGWKPSKTGHRSQIGSGTAFPMKFASASLRWRSTNQNSAHASWQRGHRHDQRRRPESSVDRLLKAHDPITSPAFTDIKAADQSSTDNCAEPAWRPTPPPRSSVGGGTISPPSLMTTRALPSPELATTMVPTMSPAHSSWR